MPKPTDYDKTHLRNMAAIGTRIDRIFKKAAEEAAKIGVSIKSPLPEDRIFSFDDYPETQKQIERLITALKESMETTIVNGVRSSWTLSNNKNNALVSRIFGDRVGDLSKEQYRRYFSTNGAALDAFMQRKTQGLNLSDRVWRYSTAFKREIELGLDLGIRTGESADQMSRSLRQYLQHPDKLFRRVRDKHGNLKLSKAARDYHPGRGVYRSSYKNARRLACTETNMAYRTSDHLRWQQMEFVVGIEIKLSNNHTLNGVPLTDICDTLAGRYPKDFKFTGWHPHCRCHVVTVLKTDDEMAEDTQRILAGEQPKKGSVNAVRDVPDTFKGWVEEHADRIEMDGNLPYFVKDNRKHIRNILHPEISGNAIKVLDINKMTENGYYEEYKNGYTEGKTIQGYMAHLMGNDSLPNVLPNAEFDKLAKDPENIVIYRGYRRNEAENLTAFKFGELYDGRGGIGEGSYFATSKLSEFSASGKYIEAVLDPRTAKIGDYDKLESQWKTEMREHTAKMRELRKSATSRTEKDNYLFRAEAYDDFGRWATAKGYDAIVHHDSRFTEYLVLNRGKLSVRYGETNIKTSQEIAAERHAKRDAAKIQKAWNARRIANIEGTVKKGLLPKECLHGLSAMNQDDLNARIAYLQKTAQRHATRTPQEIEDIKKAWEAKQKRDTTTKLIAKNVFKLRSEYPHDVDFSALEKIIADNNLTKMREEARNVAQAIKTIRAEEKALSDLIPDAHEWHKTFSLSELHEAHDKIQSTLDYWKAKGFDLATDSHLDILKKELEQKIKFVENPGAFKAGLTAHKTWEVQQKSYQELLKKTENRIELISLESEYKSLLSFSTSSKDFKNYMTEAKAALDAGNIKTAKSYLASAKWKKQTLEHSRKGKKEKEGEKGSASDYVSFPDMDKAQIKKLLDKFEKNTVRGVDKPLRQWMESEWANLTDEEQTLLTKYTQAYTYLNDRLRGLPTSSWRSQSEFNHDMPIITKALNKLKTPHDMVVRRGTDDYPISELGKYLSGLEEGDIFTEPAFLSTAAHRDKGFFKRYEMIIIVPKGARGAYAEPFSHYNDHGCAYDFDIDKIWDGTEVQKIGDEFEWIGQRGCQFKVLKKTGGKIIMQLIGQLK